MTELDKLKLRLRITDNSQDDLLTLLLEQSEEEVLDFTNKFTQL